jgi:NAD(P)-dependent dehydrogenase (short-subunit alcohol dehydrogenase family)
MRSHISPKFYHGSPVAPSADQPDALEKDLLDHFQNNVVGNVHLINVYLPLILKGNAKKVIAISTGMADIDMIAKFNVHIAAPYAISKAALNAAIAKFSAQYSSQGVLFLSISPGLVSTSAFENRKAARRSFPPCLITLLISNLIK